MSARWFVVATLLASTTLTFAQGAPQTTVHAPDGGVRQQLESIDVPALVGAPFSATVETEWIHLLPDGTSATTRNSRLIARDSSGRVFEERRFFTPDGGPPPRLQALQYRDPNRHEFVNCMVMEHVCYISASMRPALTKMPVTTHRPIFPNVKDEPLGEKTEGGLSLSGTREIATIDAGAIGNSRPEPIVKEFWYAPTLGLNIITNRFDPRTGAQNFLVTKISQSAPDPKTFQPPSGYRIVRMPSPAQSGEVTP